MTVQRSAILEAESIETNGSHTNGINATTEYVPEALYWEKYYDTLLGNYEWNNGQLEELPLSDYAKFRMYLWFFNLLQDYLYVHPLARIMGLEMGFRLTLPTKVTIRKPDLGVVLDTNPAPLHDYDRTYHGIFDICLESIPDSAQSEIDRDAITKRDEYAVAGVQEYSPGRARYRDPILLAGSARRLCAAARGQRHRAVAGVARFSPAWLISMKDQHRCRWCTRSANDFVSAYRAERPRCRRSVSTPRSVR